MGAFILLFRVGDAFPSGVPRVIPGAAAFLARPNLRNWQTFQGAVGPTRSGPQKIMSSVKATQLRPGMVIRHEGQLFTIFSVDHRTPGNKRGSMQTRMRSLRTGAIIDYRFRAEEFVERAILDEVEFEYLYNEGDDFHFMNTENYEQMQMIREDLAKSVYYLIPITKVKVEFFEEKAIGVDFPDPMTMKMIKTEPTLHKPPPTPAITPSPPAAP